MNQTTEKQKRFAGPEARDDAQEWLLDKGLRCVESSRFSSDWVGDDGAFARITVAPGGKEATAILEL